MGTSEGTRTADGGKTSAYGGHTDPGNARHNIGSFSYQHGAATGEEADRKWLAELRRVSPGYEDAAKKAGLDPGDALLAAAFMDLYTQSPRAATADGGFLDQLASLAKKEVTSTNIIDARVESYRIPGTNRCGGVGGSWEKTRADQTRRVEALVTALKAQGLTTGAAKGSFAAMKRVMGAAGDSQSEGTHYHYSWP